MTNMEGIRILSVNCQGLGNIGKRRDIFDYLRKKNFNIYCLQDTHFTEAQETQIQDMWGYNCYFSSYTSNAQGVCILFNNNFEFIIHRKKSDINGNYLALDISIEHQRLTLINLYGPNTDTPIFFETISEIIEDFDNSSYILCGDFNLVINPDLDYYNYVNINNEKARSKLLEIIEHKNLVDPFREIFPNKKRYTWRKRSPLKQSRLDFFLISDDLLPSLKDSNIESSYRSDHSIINLHLVFNDFKRGKGLWKFNNSLLKDVQYLNIINEKILETKRQYCNYPQNVKINDIPDSDLELNIDDQLFFEMLLMEIRGKTISYSSFKKKQEKDKENKIIEEISRLEEKDDMTNINLDDIENKKKELQELRQTKLKGSILRSKAQWIVEGEKPTKYFCSLESRNFTNKIIPKIQKENGVIISDQNEILQEVKNFYQDLYSSKTTESNLLKNFDNDFENIKVPKLTNTEADQLEEPISLSEASVVLKNMKNEKSPGSSGFTTEFFKVFWKCLGPFLVRSVNQSLEKGKLSVTLRQGIITCLPKGDKPRQ